MRALVLAGALVVAVVVVEGCSSGSTCSSANCNTCCQSDGMCAAAISDTTCGSPGNTCSACESGFTCSPSTRACVRGSTGGGTGGSGGATGGGTGATGGGTGGATGGGTGGSGGATGGGTGGSGGAGGGTPITCPGGALPPKVQISFPPTCARPAGCATAPSGTFNYTEACVGQDELQSFKTQVEQVCGPNTVTIQSYDGGLQGYAFFMSNQLCRTVQGDVTVKATIGNGGGAVNCTAFCSSVGQGLGQAGFTGGCFLDGGVCDCVATRPINISNQAVAYTTGPTSLTITSSGQTFETCLTGNVLTTRQIDAGNVGMMGSEPGTATLTKP